MGSWGALLAPQYMVQGGTTAEIKHLKHFYDIGEPMSLQWTEFTGDRSAILYKGTEPWVWDEAKLSKLRSEM